MPQDIPKLPSEAIELYNRYIHGEITRRDFLDRARRFAIGGLTLETIIDALMPNYGLRPAGVQGRRPHQSRVRDGSVGGTSQARDGSMKPTKIAAFEAKTRLSELLERVGRGQVFVITKRGRPIDELRSLGARTELRFGSDEGRITISNDFDARLRDMQKYGG
jgi:antitoxin (DNA-binding transcriptional repressor) of toxin-antitoxin stability system